MHNIKTLFIDIMKIRYGCNKVWTVNPIHMRHNLAAVQVVQIEESSTFHLSQLIPPHLKKCLYGTTCEINKQLALVKGNDLHHSCQYDWVKVKNPLQIYKSVLTLPGFGASDNWSTSADSVFSRVTLVSSRSWDSQASDVSVYQSGLWGFSSNNRTLEYRWYMFDNVERDVDISRYRLWQRQNYHIQNPHIQDTQGILGMYFDYLYRWYDLRNYTLYHSSTLGDTNVPHGELGLYDQMVASMTRTADYMSGTDRPRAEDIIARQSEILIRKKISSGYPEQ